MIVPGEAEHTHLALRRGRLSALSGVSEEMDGGQDVPAQDPHLFPSPNGIHSVPGMHFDKSALQQDHEIPAEIEQFPLTQGCEATPPSW